MINMKNKYIVFFKGSMVVLLILLTVVGFSFGVTFSSFVYSSNNHRAVEMYVSSLNNKIYLNNEETNSIIVKPGNNLINVKIESLNKVDTYFKLSINSDFDSFYYNSLKEEIIKKFDTVEYNINIYNNTNENNNITFKVESGYITNTIDDVKISNGYYEIKDSINTGYDLNFNNQNYKLLGINDDGSIELIGETIENNILLEGSIGFNQSIEQINQTVNNLINNENIIEVRNVNINDILKYTNNDIIKYIAVPVKKKDNNDIYVPSSLFKTENEESYKVVPIFYSPQITIDNDLFKSDLNYELFKSEKSYYLSSNYNESNSDNIEYGIYEVSNQISKLKLYDWDNNSFETNSNIRPFIKLSYKINIKDID